MLKGLKKNKVEDSKERKQETDILEPQKKWKKTDKKSHKQEEEEHHEEVFQQEQVLGKLCEELWNQFSKGETIKATKTCEKLFIEQDEYYQNTFRGEVKNAGLLELDKELFDDTEVQKTYASFNAEQYREAVKIERKNNQVKHNYDDIAVDFFKKYRNTYDDNELLDQEYTNKQLNAIGDKEEHENKKKSKKEEKIQQKKQKKEEQYQFFAQKKLDNTLESCKYCFSNKQIQAEQIISIGTSTALIIPQYVKYEKIFHLYIVPFDHYSSLSDVDEEVYEEIRNFQKCLVQAFDKKDYEVLFIENSVNLKSLPHLIIECVTLPRNTAAEIPVYFQQGIENMESDWNTHKKLYKITREQGGIRSQIPKGFPYFYVDFGLRYGYAHVVEDEKAFSKNFAHEIICNILNLEKPKVLYPEKASRDKIQNIKESFLPIWKNYDWTTCL
ncbi:CwfJ carboxy-terminal 1-like protein (macronuclear) [Tetrahymena thermophila SB210]|uniref:CwfJ carboxy-terminal 1-like protein n=1 Tax=Tetrahymena thermophila (strain SB210) TaxID=312017 RepID=Q23BN2_TETTS|nr:CwfJ carboxy-terminal 1-like protein [Tetrahymena thermophila SB210]EAR94086.1 CwfJ carboxy-terminal 1-like protein [Tetrahymena thermophila SB210]|eukprot:XP_001014331.1 CwfJ carboxy-terminal 1-like protein [Tetrahymena thermophila SB210]